MMLSCRDGRAFLSIFPLRSAFLYDIFFAFPSTPAFLVYVWGWRSNSSHVRCLCMDGSGGPGQSPPRYYPPPVTRARCTSILAGSQFGVKLVTCSQSPLPPLLSVHVITVSSLHRNANLAFLLFRVPAILYKICIPACLRS